MKTSRGDQLPKLCIHTPALSKKYSESSVTYIYSVLRKQNFSERQLDFVREKHLKTFWSKKSFLQNVKVSDCKNFAICFQSTWKDAKAPRKSKYQPSFVCKEVSMTLIWFRLLSNWKSWRDTLFLFVLSLRVIQIFQDCAGAWLNVLNVTSYDASPYISRSKEWPNVSSRPV